MSKAKSRRSNRSRNRRKPAAEPQRTCVGCRRVAGTSELVRIVRGPNGMLVVGRHEPGRGAWLCRGSVSCLEMAERRRALPRALRAEVTPGAIEALRARLFATEETDFNTEVGDATETDATKTDATKTTERR